MNRKSDVLVLLGAAVGGVLGYLIFFWFTRRGLYGLALPGGLLGLGAGLFKSRSKVVPIVCGLVVLGLALFTEWRDEPFAADGSLGYFLLHLHKLQRITLVMLAVGTFIGFWVPFRRGQETRKIGAYDEASRAKTMEK